MDNTKQKTVDEELTSAYKYTLPETLIASHPLDKRDDSRLLVMDAKNPLQHRHFYDLPLYLREGDVLITNDSRVIPARLFGTRERTQAVVEVLLLSKQHDAGDVWDVLTKPAKRCKKGDVFEFGDGLLHAVVEEEYEQGRRKLRFTSTLPFDDVVDRLGTMPLPPYIHEKLDDPERYQTVYAKNRGSVAAPTAGLHFTDELLNKLDARGVIRKNVTLHIGLGTFRPVSETKITDHLMHTEPFSISSDTAAAINAAKKENRRVIAVGTTSCRVLESVAAQQHFGDNGIFNMREAHGDTKLFIYPSFKFRVLDGLITNFHLPESTLLMLVSAFMGREEILAAYAEAVRLKYRFFSFGDAMLLLPERKKV